jgi:hypothetical protein
MSKPSLQEVLQSLEARGVRFRLEGEKVKAALPKPTPPTVVRDLEALRARRDEVRRLIAGTAHGDCPYPLPPGVRLVRYVPKAPPVEIVPISIVNDVDKFIRSCLRDLQFRLEHPKAYACAPLHEILAKLAEVGVELEIDAGRQR